MQCMLLELLLFIIVPGGGSALAYATKALNTVKTANDDQKIGVDIVRRALFNPLRQIAENAGVDCSCCR